jgi:hypothetical protein
MFIFLHHIASLTSSTTGRGMTAMTPTELSECSEVCLSAPVGRVFAARVCIKSDAIQFSRGYSLQIYYRL